MTSEVDICNRALSRLGTRATINTLAEASTEARTASIWYAATRDALLRAADWNFARRRVVLADLGSPPSGWRYRYALPVDCLRLVGLVASAGGAAPRFEVAGEASGRVVLCDAAPAEALYVARIEDPSLFDPSFAMALVDQLAAHIAYPITQKTDVAVRLAQIARASFLEAAALDASEAEGAMPGGDAEWIAARS